MQTCQKKKKVAWNPDQLSWNCGAA